MATRIAGIALLPRESRNGIYYDVEELKKYLLPEELAQLGVGGN